MEILTKTIHILASISLILVVLLQSGRGGGLGAGLGGAGSQIFGGRGAAHFLTRVTTVLAMTFFITSLTLSMLSSRHRSVVLNAPNVPVEHSTANPNATDVAPLPDNSNQVGNTPDP